jgi:RecA/RadA recombinase
MNEPQLDLNLPRITLVTGYFSSGKTELAVNLALYLKKRGKQAAIADLDVINPYFRTREIHQRFTAEGIPLIAPQGDWANTDLPVVSGEIYKYLSNPAYHLILDIGGDHRGAAATAQYAALLKPQQPEVLFVVNANRPFVNNVEKLSEIAYKIEQTLGMKITGLVNNTHLGLDTAWRDIEKGYEMTNSCAIQWGVPFRFSCVVPEFIETARKQRKDHLWFSLERNTKLPWEE